MIIILIILFIRIILAVIPVIIMIMITVIKDDCKNNNNNTMVLVRRPGVYLAPFVWSLCPCLPTYAQRPIPFESSGNMLELFLGCQLMMLSGVLDVWWRVCIFPGMFRACDGSPLQVVGSSVFIDLCHVRSCMPGSYVVVIVIVCWWIYVQRLKCMDKDTLKVFDVHVSLRPSSLQSFLFILLLLSHLWPLLQWLHSNIYDSRTLL